MNAFSSIYQVKYFVADLKVENSWETFVSSVWKYNVPSFCVNLAMEAWRASYHHHQYFANNSNFVTKEIPICNLHQIVMRVSKLLDSATIANVSTDFMEWWALKRKSMYFLRHVLSKCIYVILEMVISDQSEEYHVTTGWPKSKVAISNSSVIFALIWIIPRAKWVWRVAVFYGTPCIFA